jgi:hypothetical protein
LNHGNTRIVVNCGNFAAVAGSAAGAYWKGIVDMESRIVAAAAMLNDSEAMAKFLLPIPNGEQLAKLLEGGKPVSTRAYDDDTGAARFVTSDGKQVMCFTVTDITIDQAEMIAAECLDIEWEAKGFQDAVERVLGSDFARNE